MGMVVNGSKLGKTVDLVDNLFCYHAGLIEHLSTLNYAVTYCGNLAHGVNYLAIAGGKNLYQLFKSFGVGGEGAGSLVFVSGGGDLVGNVAVDTDSVAVALCDDRFIIHVQKLILQRRASGVYN